jgi:hypothetical protein
VAGKDPRPAIPESRLHPIGADPGLCASRDLSVANRWIPVLYPVKACKASKCSFSLNPVVVEGPTRPLVMPGARRSTRSEFTPGEPSQQPRPACDPATRVTRSLLGYGVFVGPMYVVVVVTQALLRPGFDLSRDDASLLSNGNLGWIQVANFAVSGLMVIACAVGVRRALHAGRGATWGARLLCLFGVGLIAAGVFVADPMNGFPAGAPSGHAPTISMHGALHIISAGIGFIGLIAACFVLAGRLSLVGSRRLAIASRATGLIFLIGFGAVATGWSSPAVVAAFWFALLTAWTWLATLAMHLYRQTAA